VRASEGSKKFAAAPRAKVARWGKIIGDAGIKAVLPLPAQTSII
jgi:hypothetical protein